MPLPSLHPLLALVASSALLISSPLTVSGAPDRTAAVLSFERATCAAYQRNDAAALDTLVADGYALTDGFGAITTKADDLRDARTRAVNYTAFRNEDMHVQFFDNTAIVRGRTVVQGTTRAGARVDVLVQFTDTAVLLNGRWQLVAGHVSRLPHDRG